MSDWKHHASADLSSPAWNAGAITAHDSTNITGAPTRAVYVGVTGDVVAVMAGGATVTFKAVPAGAILPIRVDRINATNTTATDMVALF